MTTEGEINTVIMGLVDIPRIDLGVYTEVTREQKKVELVLVLDNTGSMNGGSKIAALRDAANQLVDIMFTGSDAAGKVKIALVPFVTSVNINSPGVFSMNWVDQTAGAEHHAANFDASISHLALFDQIPNVEWKGCVEARAEPHDLLDTPPNLADPATLWVSWFWPDEPDSEPGEYHNNYLPDIVGGSQAEKQASIFKYNGTSASIDETPSSTLGPNKSCAQPIRPLTNNEALLHQEVNAMRAWNNSGTNIAQGMVWGWCVISPGVPFIEGAPWEDEETLKAMVVLTDGENVVWGGWDSHNYSNYTSYGYLKNDRLGTRDRWEGAAVVNDKVETLCNRIRALNVRLYTITFRLNSSTLQDLFWSCATEPELYFNSPSNEELQAVFQAIAYDLANLRLSR